MKALIDCGAMAEFIDHEFVHAHELRMYHILHPIGLYNMDRLPNEIGKITEAINLVVQYKGHRIQSKSYVSSVGHKAIVLGHLACRAQPQHQLAHRRSQDDMLPRLLWTHRGRRRPAGRNHLWSTGWQNMEPLRKDTHDIHGVYATCGSSQGRFPSY